MEFLTALTALAALSFLVSKPGRRVSKPAPVTTGGRKQRNRYAEPLAVRRPKVGTEQSPLVFLTTTRRQHTVCSHYVSAHYRRDRYIAGHERRGSLRGPCAAKVARKVKA